MTSRLRIRHRTVYEYEADVTASFNEARITPRAGSGQVALESGLATTPPAALFRYVDYWGTVVHAFDLHVAHRTLEIVGTSVVENDTQPAARTEATEWSDLRQPDLRSRYCEYLVPTPMTTADRRLERVAKDLGRLELPGLAVEAVSAWLHEAMVYERGATQVQTSAAQAYEAGRGVCQDFAHVALTLLRHMGVPARYVSGYLHPRPDAPVGEEVSGESHAWVEWFTGSVWSPFDPTHHGRPVARDHVAVGTGRDYGDVSPVRGVFAGGTSSSLAVEVIVTRLV